MAILVIKTQQMLVDLLRCSKAFVNVTSGNEQFRNQTASEDTQLELIIDEVKLAKIIGVDNLKNATDFLATERVGCFGSFGADCYSWKVDISGLDDRVDGTEPKRESMPIITFQELFDKHLTGSDYHADKKPPHVSWECLVGGVLEVPAETISNKRDGVRYPMRTFKEGLYLKRLKELFDTVIDDSLITVSQDGKQVAQYLFKNQS